MGSCHRTGRHSSDSHGGGSSSSLAADVVVVAVVVRVEPGVTPVGLPVPVVLVLPVVLPVLVLPVLASVGVRGVFGVGTIGLWVSRGLVMLCRFEAVDVVNRCR